MSLEGELVSRYAEARRNLWGKPQKPIKALPKPVEPHPEPQVEEPPLPFYPPLPAASQALLKPHEELPKPTQEELDLLLYDDDVIWREGVKKILLSYGENMRRLTSMQRDAHILQCRVAVATYLRNRGWSYPRIGQFMKRDHTSIIYLISPDMKKSRLRKESYERVVAWRAHNKRADVGPGVDEITDMRGAVFGAHGWTVARGAKPDQVSGEAAQGMDGGQ